VEYPWHFYAYSQNSFEKRRLALSCLSACRRGTTRLSLLFAMISALWNVSKANWPKFWLKSDRNNEIIYMKTYVRWWKYAPFIRSVHKRQQIQRAQETDDDRHATWHHIDAIFMPAVGDTCKHIAIMFNMYSLYPGTGNGRRRWIINMHNVTYETLFIY